MTPTQAIAAIREILSADEWSPETLDMIADTVNRIDDNEEFSVTITWLPADVLSLRPNLTADEAEQALRVVAKVVKDRSIEEGWQILDDALFFSGYKND